jgi:hypothetical protein
MGYYDESNPEVTDWEIKWATEHGINCFIYCWYRSKENVGNPVTLEGLRLAHQIHEGLFNAKYKDMMKFAIMWEADNAGVVSDEDDLLKNLMPFWIKEYFTKPNYLVIDNKPVLFIYRPEFLIDDLGGIENVAKAFDRMRQECVDAGFAGLYILGEYRGLDANHLRLMKQLGLDYTFAYVWPIGDNPTPEQAVKAQMGYIKETQALGIIPQVVTVSQAWSGWADEGTIWKIPPTEFEGLLRQAKDFVTKLPANELGSKMLLLDNWNEWSEGHYIAPYREYGFGYLDAVRKVFSDASGKHVDLIPEDIGMGPYDRDYKEYQESQEKLRQLGSKKVLKSGADEPGLIGWWAFDEEDGQAVALDYSGNRMGGNIYKASRVKGIDGRALECRGGWVMVPSNDLLAPVDGMTIECWVRTDTPDQNDKWVVNRIYGGKTDTGYRLGFCQGRPCFAIPQTDWSHHLAASEALPTGRWVYLAGTYDGKTMRIYIDGRECGSMERSGPVKSNDFPLCLGSYDQDHIAHFTGLLDEVKLYNRALTVDELRVHARRFR